MAKFIELTDAAEDACIVRVDDIVAVVWEAAHKGTSTILFRHAAGREATGMLSVLERPREVARLIREALGDAA